MITHSQIGMEVSLHQTKDFMNLKLSVESNTQTNHPKSDLLLKSICLVSINQLEKLCQVIWIILKTGKRTIP